MTRYLDVMKGGLISIAIAIVMLAPSAAVAAETTRRPVCPKVEPQRALAQQQQPQRARAPECRTTRIVPPVVDPTPFFLL